MENINNVAQEQNNIPGDNKSDITLDQFKSALENNIECKGYFDSLCDRTVNNRLDKSIESWKDKNLQEIIENEINKRYPQKTESEIKFEEQQKALEKAQEEKRQLELRVKYQELMVNNKLPMELLNYIAGKDIESTIKNIESFKTMLDDMVESRANDIVMKKIKQNAYVPPNSDSSSYTPSMWG